MGGVGERLGAEAKMGVEVGRGEAQNEEVERPLREREARRPTRSGSGDFGGGGGGGRRRGHRSRSAVAWGKSAAGGV
jgi:hypothetical protein